MVLVQKWPFFQLSFFTQYRPGKSILWYSRKRNAFLGYKNKKFRESTNWHFSQGVNPWIWSKNGHFSNFFFLRIIDQKNVFYDILQRKNAFLGSKKKKVNKSKNWHSFKVVNPWFWSKNGHFSKGVNPWFLSKNGHFSNFFFFWQYRLGKCLLWYSRTKKRLSRL